VRLPRMTTRRLMTFIVGLGLLFGLIVWGRSLKQRRDYCLIEASAYAEMEADFLSFESKSRAIPGSYSASLKVGGNTYQGAKALAYLVTAKNRYLQAAYRPWISVPTKPPSLVIQTDNPRTVFIRRQDIFPKSSIVTRKLRNRVGTSK
jgi:hypothetical protein